VLITAGAFRIATLLVRAMGEILGSYKTGPGPIRREGSAPGLRSIQDR
jgi:hypothetical protein